MDCVSNQSITTLPSFASMNQRSLVFRISLIGIDRSRLLPFSFLNGSTILSCKQKKKRTKKLFSPHKRDIRITNNFRFVELASRLISRLDPRTSRPGLPPVSTAIIDQTAYFIYHMARAPWKRRHRARFGPTISRDFDRAITGTNEHRRPLTRD